MKKLFIVALFLVFTGVTWATDYYVKTGGNDALAGTSDALAWATIAKVNSAGVFTTGNRIFFRGGDTFYGTLTPVGSGTAGTPLYLGSYGTGNVIITGFTTLTGWTNNGGNVWYKAVSAESSINLCSVNGVNTAMGRTPNAGIYSSFETFNSDVSITDNELSSSPNLVGGEVLFRPYKWLIERGIITAHDNNGHTLTYSGGDTPPEYAAGYFVQKHISTLDVANEWYYNGTNFYIYSSGTPTATIKVPTLDKLVVMSSKNYITIENINFEGANVSLIDINNCNHIVMNNCNVDYSGDYGIHFYGTSTYFTADNVGVTECNNIGFLSASSTSNVTILNSTYNNNGNLIGMGGYPGNDWYRGIVVGGSDNLIEYNRVTNTGYNAITFDQGANNTLITHNFIDRFCYNKDDGGGVYTWTAPGGTSHTNCEVSHNIIMNGIGSSHFNISNNQAFGIYMDGRTANVLVDSNSVSTNANHGLYANCSHDLIFSNNTVLGGTYNNTDCGVIYINNDWVNEGTFMSNITITHNKLVGVSQYADVMLLMTNYGSLEKPFTASTCDYNYYVKPNIADLSLCYMVWAYSGYMEYDNLAQWKSAIGVDAHSSGTPLATPLSSADRVHFVYNDSRVNKSFTLSAPMTEVDGTVYSGTIIIHPYASKILFATTGGTVTEEGGGGVTAATVTTTDVTSIAMTTASSGGNVTSDGGANITARGVCWGTSPNPATSGYHTSDGTGTGAFTSSLTGLTSGTLYYVRAYATNSVGTSYGSETTFTTTSVAVTKKIRLSGKVVRLSGKIVILTQ